MRLGNAIAAGLFLYALLTRKRRRYTLSYLVRCNDEPWQEVTRSFTARPDVLRELMDANTEDGPFLIAGTLLMKRRGL